MRELVTIRTVGGINPIENADSIECLHIGGWKVVSQKGNFQVGDLAVFFEIDSFLPASDERFENIFKGKGKRVFDGVEGYRLRTIKLRGQVSQGLALPLEVFPELSEGIQENLAEALGVTKYEAPDQMAGNCNAKGSFPWFINKTDEDRVQNLKPSTWESLQDVEFVPTLKLDGSSTTIYYVKDEQYFIKPVEGQTEQVGICSRNMLLDIESNPDNHFVKGVEKSGLLDIVQQIGRDLNKNIALQGETVGGAIQNGWEKFDQFETLVFSIFDIDQQKYVTGRELLQLISNYSIPSTVFYESCFPFQMTQEEILKMAEGPSMKAKIREGLVFKAMDSDCSFKAISNKFLLKGGE